MVSRIFLMFLIAWTVVASPAAAESTPEGGSTPAPGPKPKESRPVQTPHSAAERPSKDDEELIKNLDLIENFDLLDTVDVLGAVNTPDTPEEEF